MRLDLWLAQKFPDYSRAAFQKLIAAGRVEINGETMKDPAKTVAETDDIKVHFPHQQTFAREIKTFAKNVIYEDDNVVVINKPAGVLTHMKGAGNSLPDEFTVADFVKSRILVAKNLSFEDDLFVKSNRPGIVHRLDRATSGVLIAAKKPFATRFLQKQFANRTAHKTYVALVEKAPKLPAARIDLPVLRNPVRQATFKIDAKGKPATTDYQVLETFADGSALVELKPQTGRTHQLRVHLAHIGAPIIGDAIYNPKSREKTEFISFSETMTDFDDERHHNKKFAKDVEPAKMSRMFLHAAQLEITIPDDDQNRRETFTANLPEDFRKEILHRDSQFDLSILEESR